MKNKKPIIALGALAVVGLVAGTIAYFTSTATFDNVFTTAVYKTKSTEVFESPSNWAPGETIPKTVVTENEGTIPVAVRVTTSEQWKNENNQVIAPEVLAQVKAGLTTEPKDIAILNLSNNTATADGSYWLKHTDGKYYFMRALDAVSEDPDTHEVTKDATNSFLASVTLNSELATSSDCVEDTSTPGTVVKTCTTAITGLGKATYTLTITVDTVQFDQYQTVWSTAPTTIKPVANN